ncbi:MAG: ribokinase [candidate division Zixibacteria bacterium]|nr:ribokinase [candidate division Zixibacteria bacterium]
MITAIGNPVYDYIKTRVSETDGRILSGCSTNAALTLAKLGEKVKLIGAIGDDFKDDFNKKLKSLNIDSILNKSSETGGFSLDYYDDFGNRTLDLLGRAGIINTLSPKDYSDSKAILIGPILGEISFEKIKSIRENFDRFIFCDPQGLLRDADDNGHIFHKKTKGIEEILSLFDVVKPNELEAEILTGVNARKDPYKAAKIIKNWGPKIVVVTLAELGSVIYDGKEFIDIPPYNINLVDSTGAGDTYMAGFTFEYLRTGDLKKSGCFASSVSSVMIEHTGPDFNMEKNEVRRRQAILLDKSDFKII